MDSFFATCAPGLEAILLGELSALGLAKPRLLLGAPDEPGGASFSGGPAELARACRRLTVAERVLLRHDSLEEVAWRRFLPAGSPLAVRVKVKASAKREKEVAEAVAKAAGARLVPFDDESPVPLAYVSVDGSRMWVSVDASGAPLHRRGWRLQTAKAPLRETLAAALPLSAGWDGRSPLLDPFCGSGTIAIEAALRAAGRSPHAPGRKFAFESWDGFSAPPEKPAAIKDAPRILASDRDAGAIAAAKANAERAGVADLVEFSVRAISAVEPPAGPGVLATNPPYGERVSAGKELRDLYGAFGKVAKTLCSGWEIAMLAPAGPLIRATGLRLDAALTTLNGGLSVRVWRGRA